MKIALGQESQSESASTTEQSQDLSDGTSETADEEIPSSSNDSDSKGENLFHKGPTELE